MSEETWLCPFCSLKTMKYGKSCPEFKTRTCENMENLNINGQFYLSQESLREDKSVGIAQISNE